MLILIQSSMVTYEVLSLLITLKSSFKIAAIKLHKKSIKSFSVYTGFLDKWNKEDNK